MHKREEMRGYKEIYAVNIRKHKCWLLYYNLRNIPVVNVWMNLFYYFVKICN